MISNSRLPPRNTQNTEDVPQTISNISSKRWQIPTSQQFNQTQSHLRNNSNNTGIPACSNKWSKPDIFERNQSDDRQNPDFTRLPKDENINIGGFLKPPLYRLAPSDVSKLRNALSRITEARKSLHDVSDDGPRRDQNDIRHKNLNFFEPVYNSSGNDFHIRNNHTQRNNISEINNGRGVPGNNSDRHRTEGGYFNVNESKVESFLESKQNPVERRMYNRADDDRHQYENLLEMRQRRECFGDKSYRSDERHVYDVSLETSQRRSYSESEREYRNERSGVINPHHQNNDVKISRNTKILENNPNLNRRSFNNDYEGGSICDRYEVERLYESRNRLDDVNLPDNDSFENKRMRFPESDDKNRFGISNRGHHDDDIKKHNYPRNDDLRIYDNRKDVDEWRSYDNNTCYQKSNDRHRHGDDHRGHIDDIEKHKYHHRHGDRPSSFESRNDVHSNGNLENRRMRFINTDNKDHFEIIVRGNIEDYERHNNPRNEHRDEFMECIRDRDEISPRTYNNLQQSRKRRYQHESQDDRKRLERTTPWDDMRNNNSRNNGSLRDRPSSDHDNDHDDDVESEGEGDLFHVAGAKSFLEAMKLKNTLAFRDDILTDLFKWSKYRRLIPHPKGPTKIRPHVYWREWWPEFVELEATVEKIDDNDEYVRHKLKFHCDKRAAESVREQCIQFIKMVSLSVDNQLKGLNEDNYEHENLYKLLKYQMLLLDMFIHYFQTIPKRYRQSIRRTLFNLNHRVKLALVHQNVLYKYRRCKEMIRQFENAEISLSDNVTQAYTQLNDRLFIYFVNKSIQDLKVFIFCLYL